MPKFAQQLAPLDLPRRDRRSLRRHTTVLRVGLLSDGDRVAFCMVRNVSPGGVQVRVYAPFEVGKPVQFRVGEAGPISGRVSWCRNHIVGIEFETELDPSDLLRTTDGKNACRRSSPRAQASAHATLRTGGRTVAAQLCDISTTGIRLRTRKPIPRGSPAVLTLPDLPTIRGFVRWSDGPFCGLAFEAPMSVQLLGKWISERLRVNQEI